MYKIAFPRTRLCAQVIARNRLLLRAPRLDPKRVLLGQPHTPGVGLHSRTELTQMQSNPFHQPVRAQASMLHNMRSRAGTPCCRSKWGTHVRPLGHLGRGRAQRVHADAREQQAPATSTPAQLVRHCRADGCCVSCAQQHPAHTRLQTWPILCNWPWPPSLACT